jgi:hypothetical protein
MTDPSFRLLNIGWNAEPNAPEPSAEVSGRDALLRFWLNSFRYPRFKADDTGAIRFTRCSRYRLGSTNDEGWYLGQCRYSKIAPAWGKFYELIGPDDVADLPQDWVTLRGDHAPRHFLFYFRNETFECFAADWVIEPNHALEFYRALGGTPSSTTMFTFSQRMSAFGEFEADRAPRPMAARLQIGRSRLAPCGRRGLGQTRCLS